LPGARPDPALRVHEESAAGVDISARPADLGPEESPALRAAWPADGYLPGRDSGLHTPRSRRGDPVGDHDDGLFRPTTPDKHRPGLASGLLERPRAPAAQRVRARPRSGAGRTQHRHQLPPPERQRNAPAGRALPAWRSRTDIQGARTLPELPRR